jgi:hypothetical protein
MVCHVHSVQDIWELLETLKVADRHHIPLCKILFSLERKGYLETVLLEKRASRQLSAECRSQKRPADPCRRLHFFKGDPRAADAPAGGADYGGYCDMRPDGTVVEAFITTKTVRNLPSDSYAFLPCSFTRTIQVAPGGKTWGAYEVNGFHYIEKNRRETMCAQAALYGVIRYWQEKDAVFFKGVRTTVKINRQAGVRDTDAVLSSGGGRGLDVKEIQAFFKKNRMPYWTRDYTYLSQNVVRRECVLQDIYGFVESGMPVIAVIKTDNGMHAITVIGHTFDKNGWRAMADVGYFEPANGRRDFLPNVTWVENLIILDDNFGPYYFFPCRDIEHMIAALFVPVPVGKIMRPHEALRLAAASTLFSEEFAAALRSLFGPEKVRLLKENRHWFKTFTEHLKVQCGDGLVLRPILQTKLQIVEAYGGHEFRDLLAASLPEKPSPSYFWMVELSWPDVFCFRQSRCGSVIFSASDEGGLRRVILHLPGVLLMQTEEGLYYRVAKREDPPHPHVMPGR